MGSLLDILKLYSPFIENYQLIIQKTQCSANSIVPDYMLYSSVAIFVSVFILLLFYIISYFNNNQKLRSWAKVEFNELLVTTIILLIIPFIFSIYCNFSFLADKNIFESSVSLVRLLNRSYWMVAMLTSLIAGFLQHVTSYSVTGIPLGMGARNVMPFFGFQVLYEPVLSSIMLTASTAYTLNVIFLIIIDYFTSSFMKFFLPLALFLRAFSPTRKLGGSFLALIISFAFVYPFLLSIEYFFLNYLGFNDSVLVSLANTFDNAPFDPISKKIYDLTLTTLPTMKSNKLTISVLMGAWISKHVFSFFASIFQQSIFGITFGLAMLFADITFLFTLVSLSLNLLMYSMVYIFIGGLLFPTINTIVLITAIKELSKMLGQQIDISNLTRLI